MQIFVNPTFDFIKWRLHAVAFSMLFIAAGIGLFIRNGVNFGIDFAGGANVVLGFRDSVPMDKLRSTLADAVIQQYGKTADRAVLIRLPKQAQESDYAGQIVERLRQTLNPQAATENVDLNFHGRDRIRELLAAADPDRRGTNDAARLYYNGVAENIIARRSELGIFTAMSQAVSAPGVTTGIAGVLNQRTYLGAFNLLSQETVGPQVGDELQRKAIWAVILSTLAMFAYIWLRFDVMFGFAAMVCILHDVAIALSFLAMIRGEFNLNIVAALLLIVGYSINDTVVTYDRVRENRRKIKTRMTFGEQLNLAMNQTLSRTILTSGSVMLVLLALLLLGGSVIHEFSWILLVGVISGTYSTLLIVPAVAVAWNNRTGRRRDIAGPAARPRVEEPREETPAPTPRRRKAV